VPEHDLRTIAFPMLTERQIGELAAYADTTRRFHPGETLFHCGDRGRKFLSFSPVKSKSLNERAIRA